MDAIYETSDTGIKTYLEIGIDGDQYFKDRKKNKILRNLFNISNLILSKATALDPAGFID